MFLAVLYFIEKCKMTEFYYGLLFAGKIKHNIADVKPKLSLHI